MPTEKVVYTSGGSGLLTAVAIVFVILKLTGTTAVATWSCGGYLLHYGCQ